MSPTTTGVSEMAQQQQVQVRKPDRAVKEALVERMRGGELDLRTPSGKQLPY